MAGQLGSGQRAHPHITARHLPQQSKLAAPVIHIDTALPYPQFRGPGPLLRFQHRQLHIPVQNLRILPQQMVRDIRQARQGMPLAHQQAHPVLAQHTALQAVLGQLRVHPGLINVLISDDGQLALPGGGILQSVGQARFPVLHIHGGRAIRQHGGKGVGDIGGAGHRDPQPEPLRLGGVQALQFLHLGQDTGGIPQELAARGGELHTPGGAAEQGHPQFLFQFFQAAAQVGLRHFQRPGGGGQAVGGGDLLDLTKLLQGHGGPP